MTSKVIIRIGEKSQPVEKDEIFVRGNYRFSKDLSVVFVQTGIYYLIVTDEEYVNRLYDATAESEHTNDYSDADYISTHMIKEYIENNFEDFNSRVEKAVKTAHGIGIKKTAHKNNNIRIYKKSSRAYA